MRRRTRRTRRLQPQEGRQLPLLRWHCEWKSGKASFVDPRQTRHPSQTAPQWRQRDHRKTGRAKNQRKLLWGVGRSPHASPLWCRSKPHASMTHTRFVPRYRVFRHARRGTILKSRRRTHHHLFCPGPQIIRMRGSLNIPIAQQPPNPSDATPPPTLTSKLFEDYPLLYRTVGMPYVVCVLS